MMQTQLYAIKKTKRSPFHTLFVAYTEIVLV